MKGLRSLNTNVGDIVPTFVPQGDYKTPEEQYKSSKYPNKAKTEMSREERHTAHLRKKRTQKSAKKASDERERVMAKFDPKVRAAVEKKNTMKALAENRNVTIVKGTSKKWKHNLASTLMDKKEGKK